MYILFSNSLDAHFNIAAEAYLLKNSYEDLFFIYRNEPSVIIGKHQNTIKEINYPYIEAHGIKVVRRISGGGTVYHDPGNVNFTFITGDEEGRQIDYVRYTSSIIKVLNTNGINAVLSGKSDITVDGKKISGNAAHVFKTKVLHHGTLLFDADLEKLNEALKVNLDKFSDKAVASKRSDVVNVSQYLNQTMTIEDFMDEIVTQVTIDFDTNYERNLNQGEIRRIEDLVNTKYGTWEWNFGYSPKFKFSFTVQSVPFSIEVRDGVIENIEFYKGSEFDADLERAKSIMMNMPHRPDEIRKRLKEELKSPVIAGLDIDSFVLCFF